MIAPPGTPGAATIVIPSIMMNPAIPAKVTGSPAMYMIAMAQAVIFIVLPERWMVAQRGTTKIAIVSRTPFFTVWASVTGIVAADD